MYLNKLRVSISPINANQGQLFKRMRLAIERVEAAYSPALSFDETDRAELDQMDLVTLADIVKWESGWLRLIATARRELVKVTAKGFANEV